MKKYHIKRLGIEVTRRCNYNCVHCMRGEPQDLTITPEIIDTMFSQLSKVEHIALLGGESLLELDMLEYLLSAIDKFNLGTEYFSFVTNGSVLDDRVLKMLKSFVDKQADRYVYMRVSNDQFHDIAQSKKAIQFYRQLNPDVRIEIIEEEDGTLTLITDAGRAQNMTTDELNAYGVTIHREDQMTRTHQICVHGDTIHCILLLLANGNICLDRNFDYDNLDEISFGNIKDKSFDAILTEHNKSCYILCDESYNSFIMNEVHAYKENLNVGEEDQRLYSLLCDYRFKVIWMFRAMWHDIHPDLDMREIISIFPPLSIQNWEAVCGLILGEDIGVERAKAAYKAEFREKHPDATDEEIGHLSFMQYTLDLLGRTSLTTFYRMLKKLRCIGIFSYLPADFDVCGMIPDSVEHLREDKKD